jgi:hypothetical protein
MIKLFMMLSIFIVSCSQTENDNQDGDGRKAPMSEFAGIVLLDTESGYTGLAGMSSFLKCISFEVQSPGSSTESLRNLPRSLQDIIRLGGFRSSYVSLSMPSAYESLKTSSPVTYDAYRQDLGLVRSLNHLKEGYFAYEVQDSMSYVRAPAAWYEKMVVIGSSPGGSVIVALNPGVRTLDGEYEVWVWDLPSPFAHRLALCGVGLHVIKKKALGRLSVWLHSL